MGSRIRCVLLASAFAFSGCAVVRDHNKTIQKPYNDFSSGRFEQAAAGLQSGRTNKLDGLCFMLDTAMVRHVQGNWKASIKEFASAKRKMGGFDDRATISVSDIAETAGSFLVNEKTIPYKGEGFERILLPCYQARNYFLQGDVEGAAVEARRCNVQQKVVKARYEEELRVAKQEERNQRSKVPGADTSQYFSTIQSKCQVPQRYLSNPQNIYQLAFVDYVTGLMLEAQEDYQGARVFYGKVLKVLPQSRTAQLDVACIERRAGYPDDADKLAEQFGVTIPGDDYGSLVILFDCGEAPIKQEASILFPTGGFGFQKFALPYYKEMRNSAAALDIQVGDQQLRTETLTSVEQVAFRYFHDRLPLITVKAVIRVLAKIAAQKAAELAARNNAKKEDRLLAQALVGLGGSILMSVTEQADLRAWRTLPQTLQVARFYLPPGDYPISLSLVGSGGGTMATKDIGIGTVRPGEIQIIDVRSIGRNFWGAGSPGLKLSQAGKP